MKRTTGPRNAPPPKVNRQAGGRHPRQGQKIKGWSKPLTAEPQASIKASTQQGGGTFAAHFTPPQQTQNGRGATGSANSEMPGDHAPQANAAPLTGRGAKPKAPDLRKRR